MTGFHLGRWVHFVGADRRLVVNGRMLLLERHGAAECEKEPLSVRAMAMVDGCVVGPREWLPREGRSPSEAAQDMCMFYFGESDTPAATDRHCDLQALQIRLAQECDGMTEFPAVVAMLEVYARQGVIDGPPFEELPGWFRHRMTAAANSKVLFLIRQLGEDVDFTVIAEKSGCTSEQVYKIYLDKVLREGDGLGEKTPG